MSLPTFAENPNICREDAINQILSSIAMEEVGLSHIINAEAEKIQYALGTLTRRSPSCVCIKDVLDINKSVSDTLENIIYSQILLSAKMKNAIILENMSFCKKNCDLDGSFDYKRDDHDCDNDHHDHDCDHDDYDYDDHENERECSTKRDCKRK